MGSFVAGLLQGQSHKPAGQDASLPGFKLTAQSSSNVGEPRPTVPVLALEDKKDDDAVLPVVPVETMPTVATVEAAPTGKLAVSATLSALQAGAQPTEPISQQKGVKKATMKKPAANATKKRPAAAAPAVLRRPAATRGSMDAPESREAPMGADTDGLQRALEEMMVQEHGAELFDEAQSVATW
eukprot:s5593_g1.t1